MTDKQEFIERWNSHIKELSRLGFHLESEDQDHLDDLKGDLETLTEVAAENMEEADEKGVLDADYITIEEYNGS